MSQVAWKVKKTWRIGSDPIWIWLYIDSIFNHTIWVGDSWELRIIASLNTLFYRRKSFVPLHQNLLRESFNNSNEIKYNSETTRRVIIQISAESKEIKVIDQFSGGQSNHLDGLSSHFFPSASLRSFSGKVSKWWTWKAGGHCLSSSIRRGRESLLQIVLIRWLDWQGNRQMRVRDHDRAINSTSFVTCRPETNHLTGTGEQYSIQSSRCLQFQSK